MNFIAWLAVDKDGTAFLFRDCPSRNEDEWSGNPVGCLGNTNDDVEDIPVEFRNQKWEDFPQRVEIHFDEYRIIPQKEKQP